ncbi:30S ribosomal protein S24e [Candidatus Korarchaeum cryptofilum]|jgi:small subunit ribosomal protein S24e|uniref:Small ribosomal subunit protein eS24 n=1 Tax=Korarchaeum cryptofilum (strain OPF8) TaxID=374847 RepID=B1L6K4_KORCO|nr:30S ribosomal protein S24 [Candidatus Korarchaeum cryptofilum]ACB08083.1 Ribosomal protein S24E [Candidatus Korarchaeum cryptofilum OPF8]
MELELVKRRENPLLQREEVVARIRFKGGTPSRREIREILARQLGKAPSNVFIRRISTDYGKEEATIMAMVYHSRAMALMIEPKHIVRRNEGGEAA